MKRSNHVPGFPSCVRAARLLAILLAGNACVRLVAPVTPPITPGDGGPARVVITSVTAVPPRPELNPQAPGDGGMDVRRMFAGDTLRIQGSGFDPNVAVLSVGTSRLPLLPGSTDTELRASIPVELSTGTVRVLMGERIASSTVVVEVAGPGHVERPRNARQREPQLTLTSAGTAAVCDCSEDVGFSAAVSLNLGPFTVASVPDRGLVATMTTLEASRNYLPPPVQVVQPRNDLPDGGRLAFGPVRPIPSPAGQGRLLEVAGVERVTFPGQEATRADLFRQRVGVAVGPWDPDLRGPLFHHGVPGSQPDGPYFLALRYTRQGGNIHGFDILSSRVEQGSVVMTEGAAQHVEGEVPVAAGHMAPWTMSDLDRVGPNGEPMAALLVITCKLENGTWDAPGRVWLQLLPPDPADLEMYPPHPVELDVTHIGCFDHWCSSVASLGDGGRGPEVFREVTAVMQDLQVVLPGGSTGTLAAPEVEPLCTLFTDPCDYRPVDDDGGVPALQCVLRHPGVSTYRVDTADTLVTAAAPLSWTRRVLAMEVWESSGTPELRVLNATRDGHLVLDRSVPARTGYGSLHQDSSTRFVDAVPFSGGNLDVLNEDGQWVASVGVLGRARDLWPVEDVDQVVTVYPNALMGLDINGVMRVHRAETGGFMLALPEVAAAHDVSAYWTLGGHVNENGAWVETFDRHVLQESGPDAGAPSVALYSGFEACQNISGLVLATPDLLVGTDYYANVCFLRNPAGLGPATWTPFPGLGVPFFSGTVSAGTVVAMSPLVHRMFLNAYAGSPDAGIDESARRLTAANLETLAMAQFDVIVRAAAATVEGGLVGVFSNPQRTRVFFGCITPANVLLDRGEAAFDAHALALSPDGRRLYAGITGAVLDMDFNGDSATCPLPVVRTLVEVDGTPDVLRTDAAGRRVLWLDTVKQTQGRLVE